MWIVMAVLPLMAANVPDKGLAESLAMERAAAVSSLRYQIEFEIPERRTDAIHGHVTIRFVLKAARDVVLDFDQPADSLLSVQVNGKPSDAQFANGHWIVPRAETKAGENVIAMGFVAGNESLNRNDDFLYTLFVPARAHLAFPCFDQPDMKARYTLTLDIPSHWQAVANGAEKSRSLSREGRSEVQFAETEPLPTYLFSFAAGRFSVETAARNGRTFRMFHRETDAAKVARNREAIFDLHARALAWLEEYTAIKHPWGKFDFVLIPSFQFGGMEHAGAILYNASQLLLDESATQKSFLNRASLISHEVAHLWFGDLVTMQWFNDVWLKEVMANTMASKIVNPSFPELNHELRFLLSRYPSAYEVDRTAGANPIRQPLANLNDAGSLYGAIIYNKAPVVMRQLELLMGEAAFRDGMREYLNRYRFGNATWPDLIRILDQRTPEDLDKWSRVWVDQRGRPAIHTEIDVQDGRIARLALRSSDPFGRGLVWPQRLQVTLGYRDRMEHMVVQMGAAVVEVKEAAGKESPLFVLPNGGGLGYGLFVLDDASRRYLMEHLDDVHDGLTRASALVTLWENVIEGNVPAHDFLQLAMRAVTKENDEQNVQQMLSYLGRAYWLYLSPNQRLAQGPQVEAVLRQGLESARTAALKSAWFTSLREVASTRESLAWLEQIWRRDVKVDGLPLAETDEIEMAMELALREVPGWQAILSAQHQRIQNLDRKARFEFVMPALSADPAMREQAFARFRDVNNRQREPWVLESLAFLHHPLRQRHSERFLRESLEMLPEIQRTGDIFFPKRWADATLSWRRSPSSAKIVREFLERRTLPERLRWVVLSAADDLLRVE